MPSKATGVRDEWKWRRAPATVVTTEHVSAVGSYVIRKGLACVFGLLALWAGSKTMTNPQLWQAARHAKLLAAGGLNATEMNVGRSGAECNPVSIVAWLAKRHVHHLCFCFVCWIVCHALQQMVKLRTWCNVAERRTK